MNWQAKEVPVNRSTATVTIVDTVAQVDLAFTFQNNSKEQLEATFSFPVPASAAIFAFDFTRQDGTCIKGVCKEKQQALQEYKAAIEDGKTAALGAEQTKDCRFPLWGHMLRLTWEQTVFEISVGNILPSETVVVKLAYAVELQDDEKADEVKFVLPASTFPRYGASSVEVVPNLAPSTSIDIRVVIQQLKSIKKVACPSAHPIELELGRDELTKAPASIPDSCLATVWSQPSTLEKDFVLTISAEGLDFPRATIEARPSFDKPDTVALALTLVPRFQLSLLPAAEWLFLVDRSGSMHGQSMELVKKALLIALKGLPSKGTSLNVISFGSKPYSLFPKSKEYTEESLKQATDEVDGFSATLGGTETLSALEYTFSIRDPSKPTNVILLTDGGSANVEATFESVKKAVSAAKANAPLRVFTFGIGRTI